MLRRKPLGSSAFLTSIAGSLQGWNRRVRPRLLLRHGIRLASRVVNGISSLLSSWICNLRLFMENATGVSVPLRVVTSSSGLHWKKYSGIGTYLEWMEKSVSFGMICVCEYGLPRWC